MTDATITLAGKEYVISPLAIAQLRQIDWRILRSSAAFADRSNMTQQCRDDFFDIVHIGLTKNHPDLTKEQFDALNIPLLDIMKAVPVIIMQTGMFKPKEEGSPPTGEAKPSIGTA